jgi:hypothetical protein
MNFHITLIFILFFLPWEPGPSQNERIGLILGLNAKWELEWFPLDNFHLQWEPSFRFSWKFTLLVFIGRFSLRTKLKIDAAFQHVGENRPTLVVTISHYNEHHLIRWLFVLKMITTSFHDLSPYFSMIFLVFLFGVVFCGLIFSQYHY